MPEKFPRSESPSESEREPRVLHGEEARRSLEASERRFAEYIERLEPIEEELGVPLEDRLRVLSNGVTTRLSRLEKILDLPEGDPDALAERVARVEKTFEERKEKRAP